MTVDDDDDFFGYKELLEKETERRNKPLDQYTMDDLFIEARYGNLRVLDHPLIDIAKDSFGNTMLELLASAYNGYPAYKGGIPHQWITNKYPLV